MARRKEGGFELIAAMPWPVGIGLGLIGFLIVRFGVGWYLSSQGGPLLAAVGQQASRGSFAPLAWVVMGVCCIAAFGSFLGRRRRRQLLDHQTGHDSIRALNWQQFELLVGEAFRRQGYTVEENGLGGADGGIDLILRRDGRTVLVQCKHWRSRQVDVRVAREMFGIMTAEGADGVKIVTSGEFTVDAQRFVRGKPIELVNGNALLGTVVAFRRPSAEKPGFMDAPVNFCVAVLLCALLGWMLSSPLSSPQDATSEDTRAGVSEQVAPTPYVKAVPVLPAPSRAPLIAPSATPSVASPSQATPVIYKAEAAMSAQELREWERKNREAMKILEKSTPQMEAATPH